MARRTTTLVKRSLTRIEEPEDVCSWINEAHRNQILIPQPHVHDKILARIALAKKAKRRPRSVRLYRLMEVQGYDPADYLYLGFLAVEVSEVPLGIPKQPEAIGIKVELLHIQIAHEWRRCGVATDALRRFRDAIGIEFKTEQFSDVRVLLRCEVPFDNVPMQCFLRSDGWGVALEDEERRTYSFSS